MQANASYYLNKDLDLKSSPSTGDPCFSRAMQTIERKNVGPGGGFSYRSVIVQPLGVTVTVDLETFEFSEVNRELTYKVTFSRSTGPALVAYVDGLLLWATVNNKYVVKSPISVKLV
ncbi:hypothetical protein RHSIM_Rhsim07G0097000 [Rhododendron simsii]|uniref:Subtilisin-like protease fibronectin type-III domain-containing protein n=1 Tax=Rhododendron simsii TaxID=118357 RepID=A0A834GPR7_RHOSS|nr:hypothetical protein RHSIM_Rhsim07G0097000 [Rhododendron simsii]